MKKTTESVLNTAPFDEHEVLHQLKHYLPSQAPLKDFIHHNTLHAFQNERFFEALDKASAILGYKTRLSLSEYRSLFAQNHIGESVVEQVIRRHKGSSHWKIWKEKLLNGSYDTTGVSRIGLLREKWKKTLKINMDKEIHPLLFRLIGSYLDQGISIWQFPVSSHGFLDSIRKIELTSLQGFLRSERAKSLLLNKQVNISSLLDILVGNPYYYSTYLFDQQFAHPGWSGMVSVIEDNPETLLDRRKISLEEFIILELILEIDYLDSKRGTSWPPLVDSDASKPEDLLRPVEPTELSEVLSLWQEAYEWSFYDQVLTGIQSATTSPVSIQNTRFQALFCIDDRECSFRRHIEKHDPGCQTYGTPGFFNVEFYFKPEHGKFLTKVCPAPITPGHIIKETESAGSHKKDTLASEHSHGMLGGWIMSQTLGLWSGLRLIVQLFRPSESPMMVSSFHHMDPKGRLSIENKNPEHRIHGLQVGFTTTEMADRVEGLLKSIGLIDHFSPIVYLVGHGASSLNNTYYAGYDCGACCGRPGSVNARVMAFMANHSVVRDLLTERGITIPETTQFVGALHDTTRDEIEFYDVDNLNEENKLQHTHHIRTFNAALDDNAKERSRRFNLTNSKDLPAKVHRKVRLRSVSLFEPRPELNHATNALCIIGRREMTNHLFLDRRSFLNSYDFRIDPTGKYLLNILKAATPVCGGINLEYFFSRVDNSRLGAGTKLPHNVMGLIGLANGMDGDLRPGLPSQMVEVHAPLRLLIIVEHFPDIVLQVIKELPAVCEWYINEWVNLVAIDPLIRTPYRFTNGKFEVYQTVHQELPVLEDVLQLAERFDEDLPVYQIRN